MAQIRQQNNTLRSRYAQPAVVQAAAAVDARKACEQLEQMNRKLAAARAEISRYQTRLFACERQMIALRRENAELEAACEQARQAQEEALQAAARAEKLLQQMQQGFCAPEPAAEAPAEQAQVSADTRQDVQPEEKTTALPEQEQLASAPPEPEWQPKTELEHLSVELMNWFDEMMGA